MKETNEDKMWLRLAVDIHPATKEFLRASFFPRAHTEICLCSLCPGIPVILLNNGSLALMEDEIQVELQ